MQNILSIIKYLFNENKISNNDESLNSFFNNGVSFPKFIALIFDIDIIPSIEVNPISPIQCKTNNQIALQFLIRKNQKIKCSNPNLELEKDQIALLKDILLNQCFPEEIESILEEINLLFEPYGIHFENSTEIIDPKMFSFLLHILMRGSAPITENFQDIKILCQKFEIPLVIDESSFLNRDCDIYFIQIQIIFDFFSKYSQVIFDKIDNENKKLIESNLTNKSEFDSEPEELDVHEQIVSGLQTLQIRMLEKKRELAEKLFKIHVKIQEEKDIYPEKLWNRKFDDGFIYYNGILLEKNNCDVDSIFNLKTKKQNESKITQLFKYDEKKYCWIFCESFFNEFFKKIKIKSIPLVLFMCSDLDEVDKISNLFNTNVLESTNLYNEISVFSFNDKNEQTNALFLFVYVPKDKINIPNIQSILYQINIFLFLICDLSIVILNPKYQDSQILFIQRVIDISTKYFKEYSNKIPMKVSNQKETILSDKSQLLFIKYAKENLKTKLDLYLQPKIKKKYHIYCIQNEKFFILFFKSIAFINYYSIPDFKNAFNYINSLFPQISEAYLAFLNDKIYPVYILDEIITKRFEFLYSKKKENEEIKKIISQIRIESQKFYPKFEFLIDQYINKILLKLEMESIQIDKKEIQTQLKKVSESQMNEIIKQISNNEFLTKNQFNIIKQNHISFLQKQFFEIIKEKFECHMIEMIFEKTNDILEDQISEDLKKILEFFKECIERIKRKNAIKYQSFSDAGKKRANYVMKETEVSREIKIVINSDKDLESEIPQDF